MIYDNDTDKVADWDEDDVKPVVSEDDPQTEDDELEIT